MDISKIIKIRSIVYGGLDGIITIFNIIAGSSGAKIKSKTIIILGCASLIADAISMGISDYLSTKTYNKSKNIKENPIINGINTFLSFILFGLIPLMSFIIMNGSKNQFLKSTISSIISMFVLGSIRSKYTKDPWLKSGIMTSIYGMFASFTSYIIGYYINKIL